MVVMFKGYKLLSLDGCGRTLASRVIHCDDQGRALELAKAMTRGHAHIEVWAEGRLLGEARADGAIHRSPEADEVALIRRVAR